MQVLSSYKKEGFDFLVKVFNSSDHLEQLTGLTLLYSAADQADVSRMQVCMSAWGGRVCGGECVHCAMHAGAAQCTMQWTCHAVDMSCSGRVMQWTQGGLIRCASAECGALCFTLSLCRSGS